MILLKIKFITRFEGVAIYESPYLGSGFNSGGLALPGWGIVVGKGTYSQSKDYDVVRHEFGHFLQCRMIGFLAFSLVASAVYVLNDLVDAPNDRNHPDKSKRPIASGAILPKQAQVILVLLLSLGAITAAVVSIEMLWYCLISVIILEMMAQDHSVLLQLLVIIQMFGMIF